MSKRDPSKRAQAFKDWMKAIGTNTKQVARASGVPYSTLASFVQGDTQSLKGDTEHQIANHYGVSTADIFANAEARLIRVIGRAGADTSGELIHSNADAHYDHVPAPPPGIPANAAIEVFGDSMRATAEDGSIIYFNDQRTPPTPDMIGYPCIVELEDGRVLFKRLLRGSREGVYMLESNIGPPMDDVRIRWAAEPTFIVPAKMARRIILKAGERQVA